MTTPLINGVAATFPLHSGTRPQFSIAVAAGQTHLRLMVSNLGPSNPPYYAYGWTIWKAGQMPVDDPMTPFKKDGLAYGSTTIVIPVTGPSIEYFEVDVSATATGNASITVTAS